MPTQEAAIIDFGDVFEETTFLGGTPLDTTSGRSISGTDAKAPTTGDGLLDFFGDAGRAVGGVFDAGIGLYRDFLATELQFEMLQNQRQTQRDMARNAPVAQPVNAAGSPADAGMQTFGVDNKVLAVGAGILGLILLAVGIARS